MLTITWLLSVVLGMIKTTMTKNTSKSLLILITTRIWWYNAGHISQWGTYRASLEATGCHHRASACAVLPRRRSWLTILTANTKILTKHNFLLATHGTINAHKSRENFIPQNGPSTQLINQTSCKNIWDVMIEEEKLSYISSYQTLLDQYLIRVFCRIHLTGFSKTFFKNYIL